MKMRFGVIGCGFMGSRHVSMLNSFEELECVAVCDTDPARLNKFDGKIKCYTDIDSLLSDTGVDGVIIATPNKYHKEHVIKAAKAGKHIICEKPIAMSVADFDEMLRTAEANNVVLTAHQQRRFDRDFRAVKYVYDKYSLGNIYLIKSMMYGYNGNMHDWHVWKSEGGGMLLDWGVHLIDQILYMVKSPLRSVYADIRAVINFEVDDYYKIILRFENMLTAEIELGTYMLSDKPDWFPRHWQMFGDKGSLYIDGLDEPQGKIVRTTKLLTDITNEANQYCGPTRSFGRPEEGLIITENLPQVSYSARDYFVNFINAMKGNEELLVKPEQLRTVLSVMEAVRESGKTMNSIRLN